MRSHASRAFTLVEILIVVVILGILAAVVTPQFTNATQEASKTATLDQLRKVEQAVAAYYVRERGEYPDVSEGDGTWGGLIGLNTFYLREPPVNSWVPVAASKVVAFGAGPDAGYQTNHGWVFDPATGRVWAGSFNASGDPYPR